MQHRGARGRGSNQYTDRPGAPADLTRETTSGQAAALVDDTDPEDIAWSFHPDSRPWTQLGWDRTAATEWTEAGFDHYLAARFGTLSDEDRRVLQNTVMSPMELRQWLTGYEPEAIVAWSKLGVSHRAAAEAQEDRGVTHDKFAWVWERAGFTVEQAAEWANQYIHDGVVWDWIDIAGMTPREAGEWNAECFDAQMAAHWCAAGFADNAGLATELGERNITPGRARLVRDQIDNPKDPDQWEAAVKALDLHRPPWKR